MTDQEIQKPAYVSDWMPEPYYREGACYSIRGYRLFNKLLQYIAWLWKEHGIEIHLQDIDMICDPYISFRTGGVIENAYIEMFVVGIRDQLKEQEICMSCTCKGSENYWKKMQEKKDNADTIRGGKE